MQKFENDTHYLQKINKDQHNVLARNRILHYFF